MDQSYKRWQQADVRRLCQSQRRRKQVGVLLLWPLEVRLWGMGPWQEEMASKLRNSPQNISQNAHRSSFSRLNLFGRDHLSHFAAGLLCKARSVLDLGEGAQPRSESVPKSILYSSAD